MKIKIVLSASLLALVGFVHQAKAAQVSLADWCVNLNGDTATACNGGGGGGLSPLGGSVDLTNFDQTLEPGSNSLGFITVSLDPGSDQFVTFYADYDVDFAAFGSFDDSASTSGSLPGGWSFSANDPNATSDTSSPTGLVLFDQFSNNTLDDTNHVGTPSGPPNNCCDSAFALSTGAIDVADGGSGTVTFTLTGTAPPSGFYIKQTNEDTLDSIYLAANVSVQSPINNSPEPSNLVVGLALIGLAFVWRRLRAA